MLIARSEIALASNHVQIQQHDRMESLKMWVGERPGAGRSQPPPSSADTLTVSEQARVRHAQDSADVSNESDSAAAGQDLNLQVLMALYERVTGRKMQVFDASRLESTGEGGPPEAVADAARAQAGQRAGFGIEYDYHERYYEVESTTFSAQGEIKTADGQSIAFNVSLTMTRQYVSEQNLSLRAGDAVVKDPLVINFSGAAAQLTTTKFAFDLDSDGRNEQISFVAPGSGFLALDRNDDGKINNGEELFGASSGNGFADLAGYDQDGNHWIDEADRIYSKLGLWTKDATGSDQLTGLKAAGVGAIYLGQVATPFAVKDSSNQLQGQVAASGLYLGEDGHAGTVQQVNLVV